MKHRPLFWSRDWARCIVTLLPLAVLGPAHAAIAQPTSNSAPSQVGAAIDHGVVDRLVWSTIIAVDQANRTGNYSVLRDLGAPSFQANNSAATLAGVFANLRNQRLDLSNALIVSPVYLQPPATQGAALRAKGVFPLRPTAVGFDLMFQNISGEWRLLGISVVPLARAGNLP